MRRYSISILATLALAVCASAQTGIPPYGSFTPNRFDLLNNANGNVVFAIPIMSSPGRGLNLDFSLVYNSHVWTPVLNPNSGTISWTGGGWLGGSYNNPLSGTTSSQFSSTSANCGCIRGQCQGSIITGKYTSFVYTDVLGTPHPLPLSVTIVSNTCTGNTTYSGTYSGYATDASGYYASIPNPALGETPNITTKSGIQIPNGNATATVMEDTNGNFISVGGSGSETDWTDSAGRLALKVIKGTSSNQYKFLDPTGAYQTATLNLASINVKTNFGCSGVIEFPGHALTLPTSLVLPNNQTYTFTYEPTPGNSGYYTGRIQRVTLPTGGYYEYDYGTTGDGTSCVDGSTVAMNEVVSDGTNTATWKYSGGGGFATVTTPQLADTPNAFDTVYSFSGSNATQTKIYKESPGVNVLRTINTTWASNGTPATQVTILEDGSTQSEVDTTYDSNGLLDSVSEYDWGSGARGALLRTTTYTYQTSTNYTGLNIIDLVTSKQIKDGSGTVQYRQDISYDATTGDNQSCPTGIAQHNDGSYGCSFYYRGNPTSVTTYLTPGTPANGITKNFTYDFFGNLLTAQLNCCQNKTWGYSSASTTQNYSLPDSVTTGSSPSLKTTYAYYLPTGQVNTATDPNGLVTTLTYDFLRRLTQASQASGPSVSTSYDDTNFITATTTSIDASKSVKQIVSFDKLGRPYLTTTEDVGNNIYSKVTANYDLAGRAYQTSNPYTGTSPSYWTTTAFDVLGRPTSVTLPDNSATTYLYATNTATVTDSAGKQRKSQTDGAGRLSNVWEPDPSNNNTLTLQTSNTYNVLDELTLVTQGSQTRTFVYDTLGRILSAATPEAGTVCFGSVTGSTCNTDGYDSFDNLLKRTDARGVLTSYGYDTLNRLTSVSYTTACTTAAATASLGFNYGNDSSCNSAHGAGCIGQLITMTDGVGSENYTYNNLEQLTQLQKVISGSTYTTNYTYNLAGELTQTTYPSGHVIQQSVDAVGRLCEIAPSTTGCGTAASPYATGYGYSAASQLTGFKYGNGIYASFGFSADRLQLNCLDYSTTNRNGNCAHDSTTKFGLTYSYGSAGSNDSLISGITDSVDNGRTTTYTYDSLYRLTQAITTGSSGYPQWALSQAYDRYGNRTAQAAIQGYGCTGCPTNSVSVSATTNQITGLPYAYDLSGNMTNDGQNTLVYDAENHTVSASNGGGSGTYAYDGNGLRVQRVSGSTTTVYIFSGSKVIAEYDNGAAVGSPSREYVYSDATLLAKIDSSGTKFYHQDHLSNRYVTDSSGNKAAEMGHFPYGETWYNGSNHKLFFTTYERDSESGNDYAQARYSVSRLGRFSSPDPMAGSIADPQSLNRYSYVRNMPVMLTDPTGLIMGCSTADNRAPAQDQAQEDLKSGGPFSSGSRDEAADPDPQRGCGFASWLPGGGADGGFDDGSWTLDGGYAGDDSGMGIGVPAFGGSIIFGWERNFLVENDSAMSVISASLSPWPDSGGSEGTSGAGTGGSKNCVFNITVNLHSSNLSQDSVKAIENQIAALFGTNAAKDGSTVGVNFSFSGKSDATLNLTGGVLGALAGVIGLYGVSTNNGNPTVFTNAVSYKFGSGALRVDGIVGAHELTHKLGDIRDLPFDQKNPNLMNLGNNPLKNSYLLGPGLPPALQLTPDQIKKLFDACKKLHP